MKKSFHVHIVGQGLAGSVLAIELANHGVNVTLSDDGHLSASSMVAAGMWNPLSFKKLNPGWNVAALLEAASETYSKLEHQLGARFYHPTELVRVFPTAAQANEWTERSELPSVLSYVIDGRDEEVDRSMKVPFGQGIVQQSGWVDLPVFLLSARQWLLEKNILVEKKRGENADITVNCTGYKAAEIDGWHWIPVFPNKGQVLRLLLPRLHTRRMVNFGKFLVPLGEHVYRMGATYEFNDPNPLPTEEVTEALLRDLSAVGVTEATVMDRQAGYRPTVPDRKPLIGMHPEDSRLAIFGGFGSKGVMLVPWCARQMVHLFIDGHPVHPQVDVQRYYRK